VIPSGNETASTTLFATKACYYCSVVIHKHESELDLTEIKGIAPAENITAKIENQG
jgi:hypothetical protein